MKRRSSGKSGNWSLAWLLASDHDKEKDLTFFVPLTATPVKKQKLSKVYGVLFNQYRRYMAQSTHSENLSAFFCI